MTRIIAGEYCIERLDLIIVVPIESPDRIADQRLRSLVLDDPYGFDAVAHEVHDTLEQRIRQIMRLVS